MGIDTQDAFIDALATLSEEKNIEQITVKDLAAEVGVSSQTFYNYYKDKYDLLECAYRKRVGVLLDEYLRDRCTWGEFMHEYLKSFRQNARFIREAYSYINGQGGYRILTTSYLVVQIEKHIAIKKGLMRLSDEDHITLVHYFGGNTYIIESWLRTEMKVSEEVLTKVLVDAVPESLKRYF